MLVAGDVFLVRAEILWVAVSVSCARVTKAGDLVTTDPDAAIGRPIYTSALVQGLGIEFVSLG